MSVISSAWSSSANEGKLASSSVFSADAGQARGHEVLEPAVVVGRVGRVAGVRRRRPEGGTQAADASGATVGHGGGGASDGVALAVGDVEVGEAFELRSVSTPSAQTVGVDVARVADEGADQRGLDRVGVDAGGQRAVELDDVRLQAHDVGQAGVAGAGVVDGEARAAPAQVGERVGDRGVVGDELVLGDLDHEAVEAVGQRRAAPRRESSDDGLRLTVR